jgi:hypothetical protein
MSPSLLPDKRKRSGQPGNSNAFRHGFYSTAFTPAELRALDENIRGEFMDEIALARVNAAHLAELLKDYKNMSLGEVVSASNALNNYLDRIESLSRSQHFLYRGQTTMEQALSELALIPVEED